ncbi:DUF4838 domain-containing protein [Rubellicoccus peritrichatus]|uniref:DUF4838 domain-containing protein n=1 Tax=Rubellicoccus peritrichatus TaxID=3080537 RepID=A0AAQ3QWP1_9BACT|nr:DUF4838 domain-containing protein [Puniceicoccus sp. CR14]WOO42933.1 DUF4838 domain-containing protein [Puniceicoccus sp. CR14]
MRALFIFFLLLPGIVLGKVRHPVRDSGSLLYSRGTVIGPVFYSDTATLHEIEAAHELANYLTLVSGREWPAMIESEDRFGRGIYIGDTDAARYAGAIIASPESLAKSKSVERIKLGQRFRITVEDDRIFLDGATVESTVFAVNYFLQDSLGIRWFVPGELGEHIPQYERVRLLRGSKVIQPSFFNRVLLSNRDADDLQQWTRHNLLNQSRWNMNHNLHQIVTSEFFETKPEWFSLHGDKRIPTKGGRGPNPNLANSEVARFVASEAKHFFAQSRGAEIFSISITDNVRFDESSDTLNIVMPFEYFRNRPNYSDLVFGFSNIVAEDIWPLDVNGKIVFEDVPHSAMDKHLGALAYYWAEEVPSFPVHPRIIPYLTSDRGQWFSDVYREEDKALIKAWCSAGPEIVGTWDYYEGAPYFVPRNFTEIVGESIPFLYDSGVRAFYAEGRALWGFDAPRLWLAAQLLMDAEQDSDELMDEFYSSYFSEAELPMRAFYETTEAVWMGQPGPPVWLKYYLMPSQAELFPMEVWEILEEKLSEAEELADTPKVKERVALVRSEFEFSLAMCKVYYLWKKAFDERSPESQTELESARDALHLIAPPSVLRAFRMKENLLEGTELDFVIKTFDVNRYLLSERFIEPLVDGDETGVGPLPFVGAKLRDGWSSSSFHNESFNFTRVPLSHPRGNMAANIAGASYFNLFDWLPVESGQHLLAEMRFRGKVSPGSRIKMSLRWMDEEGNVFESEKFAEIPVGDYEEWRLLTEGSVSPPGAAWVLFGLSIQEQMPGDFLEIDSIEVIESTSLNN